MKIRIRTIFLMLSMVFFLSSCSYSSYGGGGIGGFVSTIYNIFYYLILGCSNALGALGAWIATFDNINPFLNPNTASYAIWQYLSTLAWSILFITIILKFASWVFKNKQQDWRKLMITWLLASMLIVGGPLLGVLYVVLFYGAGDCSVGNYATYSSCTAHNGKWSGQDLKSSKLAIKKNGLISIMTGFSSSSGGVMSNGSVPGVISSEDGKYVCLADALRKLKEKADNNELTYVGNVQTPESDSKHSRLYSLLGGVSTQSNAIPNKDILTDYTISELQNDNTAPSLFQGCYAIGNKLIQSSSIHNRFNLDLENKADLEKLHTTLYQIDQAKGGNFFAEEFSKKELGKMAGYYVSLKKNKDDTPFSTDDSVWWNPGTWFSSNEGEKFYTIGINDCNPMGDGGSDGSDNKYGNFCNELRSIGVENPQYIIAPEYSYLALIAEVFLIGCYIVILFIYFLFSLWVNIALITLPVFGMLLIFRPNYLTLSFQAMLLPYFLKMLIMILVGMLSMIVGIDNLVDMGPIALFTLIIIFGLTALTFPELGRYIKTLMANLQQYIASDSDINGGGGNVNNQKGDGQFGKNKQSKQGKFRTGKINNNLGTYGYGADAKVDIDTNGGRSGGGFNKGDYDLNGKKIKKKKEKDVNEFKKQQEEFRTKTTSGEDVSFEAEFNKKTEDSNLDMNSFIPKNDKDNKDNNGIDLMINEEALNNISGGVSSGPLGDVLNGIGAVNEVKDILTMEDPITEEDVEINNLEKEMQKMNSKKSKEDLNDDFSEEKQPFESEYIDTSNIDKNFDIKEEKRKFNIGSSIATGIGKTARKINSGIEKYKETKEQIEFQKRKLQRFYSRSGLRKIVNSDDDLLTKTVKGTFSLGGYAGTKLIERASQMGLESDTQNIASNKNMAKKVKESFNSKTTNSDSSDSDSFDKSTPNQNNSNNGGVNKQSFNVDSMNKKKEGTFRGGDVTKKVKISLEDMLESEDARRGIKDLEKMKFYEEVKNAKVDISTKAEEGIKEDVMIKNNIGGTKKE